MNQQHDNGTQHPEPVDDGTLLTTGEMARRSSNTLRTVRFYEEEGILRPVRRTATRFMSTVASTEPGPSGSAW